MTLPQPPLLVISDRTQAYGPLETVLEEVLAGGCRWLSVREKDLTAAARLTLVRAALALGHPWQATVGVHADTEAARKARAPHIHLPRGCDPTLVRRQLGQHVLVGVSTHGWDEVEAAYQRGADYCTLSPIFPSRSKPGYGPCLGLAGLSQIARRAPLPVLALGGIEPHNTGPCVAAGARGVAVMGTLMRADEPYRETQRYLRALRQAPTSYGLN